MVLAGVRMQDKTDHNIIKNGTHSELYCIEILYIPFRRYAGAIGPDFILMDDIARLYSRTLRLQLSSEWSARSPDFNPI